MVILESYGKLKNDHSFDRYFWQEQGPEAIFDAAYDLIQDYLLIRSGDADKPSFKELLNLFKKHNVKYLVVGGYAVMLITLKF